MRIATAVVTALAIVSLPTFMADGFRASSPPSPYVVTDLGTFGVQSAQAADVNDAGQVVGASGGHAFLWQNGVLTDLGTLGGTSAGASAINAFGQIVGSATVAAPAGQSHAVRWDNGTITDLTPGRSAGASGINDSGDIAGAFVGTWSAFLWRNGVFTSLGQLGPGGASPSAINNSAQIVGSSYIAQQGPEGVPFTHAFLWQNGVMTDLGTLAANEDSGATGINNLGQIVGWSSFTDPDTYETTSRSFLYQGGVTTVLPVPSAESYASDINDSGVVVGTMRAPGGVGNYRAYVYADGVATNLNSLLVGSPGLDIVYANGINNAGQIAGVAYDAQMALHAVLLTPVPPGTPVVNVGSASVTEGHTGTQTATFTVTLSSAASQALTLSYSTANGTATAGSDYQAASGTVTFAAGQGSKTINVLVNGDRVGEPNETFFLNVGIASGSAVLGDAQGQGTIVDDEPRVGITSVTKFEGNSGTTQFVFTASLSAASTASVTVDFATANGSAVAPSDYAAQSGTLTFAQGQTSKTITVLVNGDRRRESQEVFYVNLPSASGAYIPQSSGVNIKGTGVIKNDD